MAKIPSEACSPTSFSYDGAGQLVSEVRTGPVAFTHGYSYDHNGNRLTQTQNGSVVQSFTYDAHDKLTSGTAGNESDTYDLNGSETRISLGGSVYQFVYDDEDRLVQANYPGGVVDTFVYNGLGLRVAKTDSTGSYSYLCDGASAASPVLWDGHAVYTPGLSENRGGSSSYYENDRLGNLWTLDYGSGKGYSAGYNFSGFGSWVYAEGSTGNPFKFGGGNGCQTDADIGLVLMGHRYYDTRIGRFISQDPAGDGDNWYSYAGNDPMDEVDPTGLFMIWQDPNPDDHQPGTGTWNNGDPTGMVGDQYTNEKGERVTHWIPDAGYVAGTWLDNNLTFGTVTHAAQVAGAYDSGHASRIAVFGAGALAAATIVAAGASRGEDAAVVDAERGIGGWITKDVFSTLEQKVGKADIRKFVAALKKGVVGPRGESGIKRLGRPVGDFTHELKIGGSGNRILGKLGQWKGQAMYIFSELSGHLD